MRKDLRLLKVVFASGKDDQGAAASVATPPLAKWGRGGFLHGLNKRHGRQIPPYPPLPRGKTRTSHAKTALIKGFTLIELLVVLSIIATLLTLAAPRYFQHVERSKEAVLRENLAGVRQALDQYHADKGAWPATLQALVDDRYLRALPLDPITESNDTWVLEAPPDDKSGEHADGGIYNLRSGAEGNGSDGKPYAEL